MRSYFPKVAQLIICKTKVESNSTWLWNPISTVSNISWWMRHLTWKFIQAPLYPISWRLSLSPLWSCVASPDLVHPALHLQSPRYLMFSAGPFPQGWRMHVPLCSHAVPKCVQRLAWSRRWGPQEATVLDGTKGVLLLLVQIIHRDLSWFLMT